MLNGALLGAGNIARNGHLPAYLNSPEVRERLRIAAVADPCPENLAAVAQVIPGVHTYADPGALFDVEQLDFVDICAPPYAHRQLIEEAVAAGCHVLCEKPLTTDLDDALALRRLLAGSELVAFPCHQYRYAPQWRALQGIIESQEVGEVVLGLLSVRRTGANLGVQSWQPVWRTQQCLAGGGILVDHGTHLFYQLHALFGPPRSIACHTERRLDRYEVEDTATVIMGYPHRMVRLDLTWAADERFSSHRYIGQGGEVACLDDCVLVRRHGTERRISFAEGLSHGSAHSDWFVPLLIDFADRITRHDYRLDRFDEAITTAAYITRAYASASRDGEAVEWVEPLCEAPFANASLVTAD